MQDVLNAVVTDGRERGVQLAVYLDGELIVDAWAGMADPVTNCQVDGEILFPVFSASKGMAATLIHLLVDEGKLTYDTPIADVWPEFAAHGKGGIAVKHALKHTAGLPNMPMGLGYKELVEHPLYPPGEQMEYHAITYSWLVGEVARRVDGRPVPQQIQEKICQPLGITGLFIGLPEGREFRIAVLDEIFDPGVTPDKDDTKPRYTPGWMMPFHEIMHRADVQHACGPGYNGIMNARSIAKHWAALLPGGVDGVELLPPSRIREATALQESKIPTEWSRTLQTGLGYFLGGTIKEFGSRLTTFGNGGYIGSMGFADPEYRLAVGLCKNLRSTNNGQVYIYEALRDALGIPQ